MSPICTVCKRAALSLTDDCGENRERVVLSRCAFPQFWHVISRRHKIERSRRRFKSKRIKGVEQGRRVLVCHRVQRYALTAKAFKCRTFAHGRSVRWALFPRRRALVLCVGNGSVARKVRHLLSDTSRGYGWSVRASLCQI